jgi:hypothetical protein
MKINFVRNIWNARAVAGLVAVARVMVPALGAKNSSTQSGHWKTVSSQKEYFCFF